MHLADTAGIPLTRDHEPKCYTYSTNINELALKIGEGEDKNSERALKQLF